jgi:tetratricopeptide (TPR) repeat protein
MAWHDYKQALELNRNRQTFRINKDDSISYQRLYERICWCLVCLNDADAVITIQKGLLEFPESIALTNAMSLAYTKTGDFSLAEKWAKKVLEKDAGIGYFRLAYLASKQDRHQESIKYYEKCLELNPNDSSAKNNLANQYIEIGQTYDALTLFREAAQDGNKYSQNWLKRNGYTW